MSTVQSLMLMSTKGILEITHEVQIKINKETCCLTIISLWLS